MTAPNPPTDADDQPQAAKPPQQVRKDNRTIDRIVWAWTLLIPLAFVIIWAVKC